MAKVMGVRFLQSCRPYYFGAGEIEAGRGDKVIVSTSKGTDIGVVLFPPVEMPEDKITQPLQPVLRLATADDLAKVDANREKEKKAFAIAKEKIELHNPEMKLVSVEYAFDGSKILFYFIADGRVDFRDLVRDLAGVFRTRIELRQIGVRDEARMKGGIGVCGRELCCVSYMADFAPVSIKMAKDQNLSLNPTKISGNCGRLMCCLKNEEDTYEYLNAQMPRVGKPITLPNGETGSVASVNVLRQTVRVLFINEKEEKEIREYTLDEIRGVTPLHTQERPVLPETLPEADEPAEPQAENREAPAAGQAVSGNRRSRDRRRGRGGEKREGEKREGEKREGDGAKNRAQANTALRQAAGGSVEDGIKAAEEAEEGETKKSGRSRRRRRPDKPAGEKKAQAPAAEATGAAPAPEKAEGAKSGGRPFRRRRHHPNNNNNNNGGSHGAAE